jgi:hypothetical protein
VLPTTEREDIAWVQDRVTCSGSASDNWDWSSRVGPAPSPWFTTDSKLHTRLNLTAANSVYILEPQWNPKVESQAIARVLRFGQHREVRVVRYIMRGTVEEVLKTALECF